jgi:PAS domain S-box-containing protein
LRSPLDHRARAHHRRLLEHLPVCVLEMTADGGILQVNAPGVPLLGAGSRAQIAGRNLSDLVVPGERPLVSSHLAAAAAGAGRGFECTGNLTDPPRLLSVKLVPAGGGDSGSGLFAVIQDLTEHRRVEDELRRSEAKLRQIVDLVPHFIFAKDVQGRFILVNKAVADAYGTTVEDLLGKTDAHFNPNEDEVRHFREDDLRVIESGRPKFVAEETITDVAGNLRYLQTIKIPFVRSGTRDPAILGVSVDITDRKRSEEERLKLEGELQTARRMESLGVLAGGIAHDFNNLLVGIIGNAKMALMELAPDSPARSHIDDLIVAGTRASELSAEMLAYSGRGTFVVEAVDLSDLVGQMMQLLTTYVAEKAEIRHDLPAGLPAVEADSTQIRQVVMNLITNSADAIPGEGGVISISTGVVHCDRGCIELMTYHGDLAEGPYVYFEVADNGTGMDMETRTKLFEPFYTTKFTGRGLGLSAVLGTIRAHRGAVHVESSPGVGSRFRVLLPVAPRPVAARAPDRPPPPVSPGTGTILVIDDEPTVRLLTGKVLEHSGYTVLTAAGGEGGLELYRRRRGDITAVVLDMTMPGMGGLEVLKRLRALDPGVKVLLSSGFTKDEVARAFAREGFSAFLHKPFDPQDLLRSLAQVIAGKD